MIKIDFFHLHKMSTRACARIDVYGSHLMCRILDLIVTHSISYSRISLRSMIINMNMARTYKFIITAANIVQTVMSPSSVGCPQHIDLDKDTTQLLKQLAVTMNMDTGDIYHPCPPINELDLAMQRLDRIVCAEIW